MGHRLNYLPEDEEDIDFGNTTEFAMQRYNGAIDSIKVSLSVADRAKVCEPRDWLKVQSRIRKLITENERLPTTARNPTTTRLLTQIIPLPRTLGTLVLQFEGAVYPSVPDLNIIWGMTDLVIKLSSTSPENLNQAVGWMKRLRSAIELFNRCLGVFEDMNESRYAMIEVIDSLLSILSESIRYLRRPDAEAASDSSWRSVEKRINDNLDAMYAATKNLNDINSYSTVNLERLTKTLNLQHGPSKYPEEHVTFPISMIPRANNENFFGRTKELKNVDSFLGEMANNLRTYTIYGRRGVGKTNIALEYAYTNPSKFEAIFWVNCETSTALRQSFTDIAVALNIPAADRNGDKVKSLRHYSVNNNQVITKKIEWLSRSGSRLPVGFDPAAGFQDSIDQYRTERRWLMIFDNAEREDILKGYWPVGVRGSILITSRKFYNFINDAQRKGETIKPFNARESWFFLMKHLGPDWVDNDRKGLIKASEQRAAEELLKSLGGLALAIEQAAGLIKDDSIGGPNIVMTYEEFKSNQSALPERRAGPRSDIVTALDTLWNMRFTNLSRNSLALMSVLSLLSPDGISINLFLPTNQQALDGKLEFCKQNANEEDDQNSEAALASVISTPPLLRAALNQLVTYKLIKEEGRELWAHRAVQEAMNYHSARDLQNCFDAAVALVYEAFPKQVNGHYLSGQWGQCENYISHGVRLSFQFASLNKGACDDFKIKGNSKFIDLLSNCAWFLYEVSDYELCLRLVETATVACDDTESLRYATLCMTAGSAYYELNQLSECRTKWELSMQIREAKLPKGHLELSNTYHNMGNLESADTVAANNLEKATEYFNRAIAIRIAHGDTANSFLAKSYLCMSRVHFLAGDYEKSSDLLGQSEALYYRISGADAHFFAHVHYAYGNIDFAQGRWPSAKRTYEASLKIGLATAPIHPITAAAYYSLGCVEQRRGNLDNAKAYLDKAMAIARLRNPDRDDGTMARIMWKTSQVLESGTFGASIDEVNELRVRAELVLKTMTTNGKGGIVFSVDDDGNPDPEEMEDAYDSLVPGYFR